MYFFRFCFIFLIQNEIELIERYLNADKFEINYGLKVIDTASNLTKLFSFAKLMHINLPFLSQRENFWYPFFRNKLCQNFQIVLETNLTFLPLWNTPLKINVCCLPTSIINSFFETNVFLSLMVTIVISMFCVCSISRCFWIQWQPLFRITLGQHESDNNNRCMSYFICD